MNPYSSGIIDYKHDQHKNVQYKESTCSPLLSWGAQMNGTRLYLCRHCCAEFLLGIDSYLITLPISTRAMPLTSLIYFHGLVTVDFEEQYDFGSTM